MKTKLIMLFVVALAMWAMKRYYADASVDELRWILGPTAQLVMAITGVPFEWEAGQGYLSRERLFLIEKACAGLNFMIAAFGMVAWVLCHRAGTALSGAAVVSVSIVASYSAAVLVNAMRIAAGMWLAAHPLKTGWISAAQIHRAEGIVCYFAGLVLLYELLRRLDSAPARVRGLA